MTAGFVRTLAWLAAAWAVLFAIPSFYWAFGGEFALDTIADSATTQERTAGMVALLLVTGAGKLVGAALALFLPRLRARRSLVLLAALAGFGMLLYASALFIQHGLMLAGHLDTPDALGTHALRWHIFFWDPWWFVGGALFLLLASTVREGDTPARRAAPSSGTMSRPTGHTETE